VRECIDNNEGLKVAARKIGITSPGLSQYLDNAGYHKLRVELGESTRIATSLPIEEHIRRLTALSEEKSQAAAARRLGISAPGISKWLKDNGYSRNFKSELEQLLDDDE
jgi:DNA transposition AAA+ family ATPase